MNTLADVFDAFRISLRKPGYDKAQLAVIEAGVVRISAISHPRFRKKAELFFAARLDFARTQGTRGSEYLESAWKGLVADATQIDRYLANQARGCFVEMAGEGAHDEIRALVEEGCDLNGRGTLTDNPLEVFIAIGNVFNESERAVKGIDALLATGATVTAEQIETASGSVRAALERARLRNTVAEEVVLSSPRIRRATL